MILRRQLRSWGVEAVEATSGPQALVMAAEAAREGREFDIGVLDLNMPDMDGIELASLLKSDPTTANTTLFLLSSSGERLGVKETKLKGFAASLTKPVRQSELYDCLIMSLSDEDNSVLKEIAEAHSQAGEVRGKILLVEDNKMNQLVGSKVLAKLGYQFDIASHGGEAVQAVMLTTYDAILMDCQMPEMDGYEATVHIRRLEGSDRHTPIIAMTAAAMEGDREKCLAAGMDDYITKPVRPRHRSPRESLTLASCRPWPLLRTTATPWTWTRLDYCEVSMTARERCSLRLLASTSISRADNATH